MKIKVLILVFFYNLIRKENYKKIYSKTIKRCYYWYGLHKLAKEIINYNHRFMNDIEYVDLGLSVKWATCNLGATSPEETGKRYTFDEKSEVTDIKIPTKEQWKELINNCTWEWKNKGVVITGKNGNSIFLPAVGELNTDGLFEVGNAGSYWSTAMSSTDKYSYYMSFIRKRPLFDWKYKLTKGIYSTFNSARTLVIRSVQ